MKVSNSKYIAVIVVSFLLSFGLLFMLITTAPQPETFFMQEKSAASLEKIVTSVILGFVLMLLTFLVRNFASSNPGEGVNAIFQEPDNMIMPPLIGISFLLPLASPFFIFILMKYIGTIYVNPLEYFYLYFMLFPGIAGTYLLSLIGIIVIGFLTENKKIRSFKKVVFLVWIFFLTLIVTTFLVQLVYNYFLIETAFGINGVWAIALNLVPLPFVFVASMALCLLIHFIYYQLFYKKNYMKK